MNQAPKQTRILLDVAIGFGLVYFLVFLVIALIRITYPFEVEWMEGGMLTEEGQPRQTQIVPLLMSLVAGVGLGSVLAGIASGGKVELGILPLGAFGISVSAMLLFTVRGDLVTPEAAYTPMYFWACLWLFTLGISAGLFDVPLAAFMQHRSPHESRGAILAASNFLTFARR